MKIKKHTSLTDNELENKLRDLSLKPTMFSHEAHLRLAWIHIEKYGEETAIDNLSKHIKNYAKSLGLHDKFNKTVTVASVKIINQLKQQSKTNNFNDFINENSKLNDSFLDIIKEYYSFNVFKSSEARNNFIQPDLKKF